MKIGRACSCSVTCEDMARKDGEQRMDPAQKAWASTEKYPLSMPNSIACDTWCAVGEIPMVSCKSSSKHPWCQCRDINENIFAVAGGESARKFKSRVQNVESDRALL
jgi:hypothetical protein